MLEGKGITKTYGDKKIIEDVSLHVKKGEMVCILGVSGIGKTTLFNVVSGLEKPDEGEVFLDGERITGCPGKIGYMQQSDLLLPFKSIAKNVMIPCLLKGMNKKDAREKAEGIIKEFGLYEARDMYPVQLSGGMRQRAALARTFMTDCTTMLFDEPFSALDAMTRRDMQKWFKETVKKHGISALFITHDIDEAIILSDRIYILGGEVGKIHYEIETPPHCDDVFSEEFLNLKKEIIEKVR